MRTFRTVTVDNGSEFYHWRSLERSVRGKGTRTAIYYAHPYSSWERGSNEQFNSMVRFFNPKGSSIAKRSRREIQAIEYWVNNYPRRILGGDSAKTASARAEAV